MGRCNFLIFQISKLGSKFDIEYTGWDQIGGDVVLWDITQFDGREAVELILLSLSSHLLNQILPPPPPPNQPTSHYPPHYRASYGFLYRKVESLESIYGSKSLSIHSSLPCSFILILPHNSYLSSLPIHSSHSYHPLPFTPLIPPQ